MNLDGPVSISGSLSIPGDRAWLADRGGHESREMDDRTNCDVQFTRSYG